MKALTAETRVDTGIIEYEGIKAHEVGRIDNPFGGMVIVVVLDEGDHKDEERVVSFETIEDGATL